MNHLSIAIHPWVIFLEEFRYHNRAQLEGHQVAHSYDNHRGERSLFTLTHVKVREHVADMELMSAKTQAVADKPVRDVSGSDDIAVTTFSNGAVSVTHEDSVRIRRKTDKVILTVLVWVYFLQILDKTVLGYGALFGLQESTGLTGNRYSLVGSIGPIAQLAWQPFSMFLIVKVPPRILMSTLVLGMGISQGAIAASYNYVGLLASCFFLGLFQAGCLPLFSIITSQWYRRVEQPLRVAAWYSTNGAATIVASAISFGLGHIPSERLQSWQILFLFTSLITLITAPFVYWKLDNNIHTARFLTEEEKAQAVERLRANQTGTGAGHKEFKWSHVIEAVREPKTYLWIAMSLLLSVGSAVTNVFGPLILNGLGYDKYHSSLLNIPFGAIQLIAILVTSHVAQKCRVKSAILVLLILPVIAGLAMLHVLDRNPSQKSTLLVAYYMLAILFGGVPLIVAWIVGNTAGATKQSVITSLYNAGSSAGNIIGPLLFNKADAPSYHPGLRNVLGIFVVLVGVVLLQAGNLVLLNQVQKKRRIADGKEAAIVDRSMEERYIHTDESNGHGGAGGRENPQDHALLDLTDRENNEFVYIY
ncbi:MFS transporter [Histoplasma capsulatum G186AR]|uniref:MFS transporter n=1 Tax=Ajellomyces capsulatus TaxID=5037 RepID=A0A8H7Z7S6_AJECA|nr:MFS transporter [Histoplasma capsulatum]QSS69924.1 MFS transporter [Histoplasma capsulatum G186AR]